MKKQVMRQRRQKQRDVKSSKKRVVSQHQLNLSRKKSLDKEVQMQMRKSNEFIRQVEGVLRRYAERIETKGFTGLEEHKDDIMAILTSIDRDLEDFKAEYSLLEASAQQFLDDDSDDKLGWMIGSLEIVQAIDGMRGNYIQLFALNMRTLLTYEL